MSDAPRVVGKPWVKGQSGNPGGKKMGPINAARELIGSMTRDGAELFEILIGIARGGEKDADRVKAADILLERLYGKAPQQLDVTNTVTPAQQALLDALALSPHERRVRAAEIRAELAEHASIEPTAETADDGADS